MVPTLTAERFWNLTAKVFEKKKQTRYREHLAAKSLVYTAWVNSKFTQPVCIIRQLSTIACQKHEGVFPV